MLIALIILLIVLLLIIRLGSSSGKQESPPPLRVKAPSIFKPADLTRGLPSSFVAFDIETTGLDCKRDEIIEIAAVKLTDGKIADTFESLVASTGRVPSKITSMTGIDDRMLKGQPPISEVLPRFLAFVGDLPLAAHNSSFDCSFIHAWAYRLQFPCPTNQIYDTLYLSRQAWPDFPNHKLNTLIQYLGLRNEKHHRALSDAHSTAKIMLLAWDAIAPRLLVDRHYLYQQDIASYYRKRNEDPLALDKAMAACLQQIEIAPQVSHLFKKDRGIVNRDGSLAVGHKGFEQLAVVYEKQGKFQEAIDLSLQAQQQGWAGDWENRVQRCHKRMAKQVKTT